MSPKISRPRLGRQLARPREDLGPGVDRRHRRSQLVGEDADERVPDRLPLARLGDVAEDDDRLVAEVRLAVGRGPARSRPRSSAPRRAAPAAPPARRRGRGPAPSARDPRARPGSRRRSASSTSGKTSSAAGLARMIRPSRSQTTTPSPIARITALSSAARACSASASRRSACSVAIRSRRSRATARMRGGSPPARPAGGGPRPGSDRRPAGRSRIGLGAGVGVAGQRGADRLVEIRAPSSPTTWSPRRDARSSSTGRPNCSTAPRLA